MHTFRLLHMAKEIGAENTIKVKRPDRDFLLAVKNAEFEYEELVERAEKLRTELEIVYEKSNLMERPDLDLVNELLVAIREQFYK